MPHTSRILVSAAAAATLALAGATSATAATPATTVCEGALSNVAVHDVFVPYDAECTLTNVVVDGNVTAEVDSRSVTLDRTVVTGNLALETQRLVVGRSAIGGSLSVSESRNGVVLTQSVVRGDVTTRNTESELRIGSLDSPLGGNVIGGSLRVSSVFGDGFVARNAVAGDLSVTNAQATIQVRRNIVRGALSCTGNDPAPIGGGNVAGSKLGQCSGF